MKKIIIGLAGVKQSGKSTIAGLIKESFYSKESAFADKLKNTCSQVFDIPLDYFHNQKLKEVPLSTSAVLDKNNIASILSLYNINPYELDPIVFTDRVKQYSNLFGKSLQTPRDILQIVGTEVLRKADTQIHCKNLQIHDDAITIVSDVRFPNEYDYLSNLPSDTYFFLPIYVNRKEAEEKAIGGHSSETSVFLFKDKCRVIDNNFTLQETKQQVISLLIDLV